MPHAQGARQRIAVLGGGMGALTAAFALTEPAGWQDAYDITVYQQGWRLGGKCASGRNAAAGQRIEEHGLHVWAGFYDNAFRLIKRAYEALGRPPDHPLATWRAAFAPVNAFHLMERVGDRWMLWPLEFPGNGVEPGTGDVLLRPFDYIRMLLDWMVELHERTRPGGPAAASVPVDGWVLRVLEETGSLAGDAGQASPTHLHAARDLARSLHANAHLHTATQHHGLMWLLETFVGRLRDEIGTGIDDDAELRRAYILLDLGATTVRGLLADGVPFHGFDAIDDREWSAWLLRHGASPLSVESAIVRGIYDYVFGFRGGMAGDAGRGVAAGTAIRGLLRLTLTYKTALFFEMQAGMGDAVIAPLYQALRARGVRFRFFHRVTGLEPDRGRIARIRIARQVDLRGGDYEPLVVVKGVEGWPSRPHYDQIVQGRQLREQDIDLESAWTPWPDVEQLTLEHGRDFDQVVLGISLGALRDICKPLCDADAGWRGLVEHVGTVQTLALQLWFRKTSQALGAGEAAILTAFAEPLDTWAEMSHLLPREAWPARGPKSLGYFCGPFADAATIPDPSDHDFPRREQARAEGAAARWIEENLAVLLPGAAVGGRFDWKSLYDPAGGDGPARLAAQYVRCNINPSDRYVLSLPGSTRHRLRADESGFANLYLAGDWVRTGLNAGCVEAAVMAGLAAARAISGRPIEIPGEFDLLDPPDGAGGPLSPALASPRAQNLRWPYSGLFGVALTSADMACLPVAAEAARAMLPPGLDLAPQRLSPAGTHPLIFMFGRQQRVRPNLVPGGLNYLEFILAVPFVRHADPALAAVGPLIYMPCLFLNSLRATLLGILGYGYNKQMARMTRSDGRYAIRDRRSDAPIISAEFATADAKGRSPDFGLFRRTRTMFELPLVSRNGLGRWQYSYYDFSLDQAELQPIEARITIDRAFATGLPTGSFTSRSIRHETVGAFRIWAPSTLTNPLASRELRRLIAERHEEAAHDRLLPVRPRQP